MAAALRRPLRPCPRPRELPRRRVTLLPLTLAIALGLACVEAASTHQRTRAQPYAVPTNPPYGAAPRGVSYAGNGGPPPVGAPLGWGTAGSAWRRMPRHALAVAADPMRSISSISSSGSSDSSSPSGELLSSSTVLLELGAAAASSPAGRGRGRGRSHLYFGPSEFDDQWWLPPPPIGADPFLQGYSSHVYPRHAFGYAGAPKGGYGNAHHFWGGPSYHYPLNMPWWRGRAFNSRARSGGSPYLPYYTPRDSYGGVGQGGGASAGSYYYSPPPLQGDWNLPKNPPPPPGSEGGK